MMCTRRAEREKSGQAKQTEMREREEGGAAKDMNYSHLVSRRYYSDEDVMLTSV